MKHGQVKLGDIGEEVAKDYLVGSRFRILAAKYKKRYGEIDLVAEKSGIIHFIEVKTSWYYPETSFPPEVRVNHRKSLKLKKICETYLRETDAPKDQRWQIDVIPVILNADGSINSINNFENAVFDEPY